MVSTTKKWLQRHRTGFAIGFGVIGAGYVAGQYILSKITEARERMADDRIAKENLRRRFQQNQEDCTFTVLELLPTVAENILKALPSEKITHELQQKKAERLGRSLALSDIAPSGSSGTPSTVDEDGKSLSSFQFESYVHASQTGASPLDTGGQRPAKTKGQLWNELKISSITRSFTLLYTISLLVLLTRIQLNLLGRRSYLSSVIASASHPQHDPTISLINHDDEYGDRTFGNDFDTNRRYLTFSWWLLHRGWMNIRAKVEAAVKEVFGPLKPTEEVPLDKLSNLILDVRRIVEGSTPADRKERKWIPFLLPPSELEASVLRESGLSTPPPQNSSPQDDPSVPSLASPSSAPLTPPPLRHLVDETSDLIDSPLFTQVLTVLLDVIFSQLVDQKLRSEAYNVPSLNPVALTASKTTEVMDPDPETASVKLATVLAVMTREAHRMGAGVPNEYVQAMEGVNELEAFAAVIYSNKFDYEAGCDTSAFPDTAISSKPNREGKTLKDLSESYSEEFADVEKKCSLTDKAIDVALAAVRNVWNNTTGSVAVTTAG